ncbi:MAG: TRAP transporter substrate-binding protein DctP [Rhodospirillaceae bacterium]|jgi:TRAP-type mannitol/chloroaromatic compound transport system substrate-binding protein|nr:TRAP transporter substrate-binding protein DctP [Rhodospirillaceae bacterium]MBT6137972.1 TRAP transporter substrate-binding protein DctP [Rhodospirillaceae bacterium]
MMKKQFAAALGGAALIAGLALAPQTASAEKLSMATPWGGGPLLEMMAKGFAKRVAFNSNNELTVEVFPGGTLGKALKVTDTVRKGVAQIGHNWAGYDWGIDRTGVLFGGFAGSPASEIFLLWYIKGGGNQLLMDWRTEKFNVASVVCGAVTREIFLHSHKKVQSLADFKGMKIRTSGAWAEIAQTLGASTVILAGAEVYPALERKVVDAIEWGTPSMNKAGGFYKAAKYIIVPGLHQPAAHQDCPVNMKTWEGLSSRNKQIILDAGNATAVDSVLTLMHDDAPVFEEFMAGSNIIIDVDQEFKDAAAKATAEWAAKQAASNKWFSKVWDHQQAYVKLFANAHRYR